MRVEATVNMTVAGQRTAAVLDVEVTSTPSTLGVDGLDDPLDCGGTLSSAQTV